MMVVYINVLCPYMIMHRRHHVNLLRRTHTRMDVYARISTLTHSLTHYAHNLISPPPPLSPSLALVLDTVARLPSWGWPPTKKQTKNMRWKSSTNRKWSSYKRSASKYDLFKYYKCMYVCKQTTYTYIIHDFCIIVRLQLAVKRMFFVAENPCTTDCCNP